ncbi:MAG: glycosyltransferase family 2 protein [Verrucomicrobiaceae bacterium]|nr:glycosyltransferase family 2 protein [Verrucomicrobiaceae bacterium]
MSAHPKPEVTVIISVYKRIDFLARALQSALVQTFQGAEIIVADDSGTAAARALCEPWVKSGQVQYRANPQTLGIARSLRGALEEARGEFISILNDDDLWEPNFLSSLVPPLRSDVERVVAFSDHWIVLEDGSIDPKATEANSRRYGRASLAPGDVDNPVDFVLVKNGVPLAMAALFRKDAIDLSLLSSDVSGSYDFWISCLLAASGKKFYYVADRLTRYRVHPKSETARRDPAKSENLVFIFSQLLERNWFPEKTRYLRSRLAGAFFRLGRDRLFFNRLADSRSYFRKSFATRPGWRPILATLLSFLPRTLRIHLKLSLLSDA